VLKGTFHINGFLENGKNLRRKKILQIYFFFQIFSIFISVWGFEWPFTFPEIGENGLKRVPKTEFISKKRKRSVSDAGFSEKF